jgi:hypothetical protein
MRFAIALAALIGLSSPAFAHDPDNHDNDEWYASIKMPGTETSCCGIGDAYYCNDFRVEKDGNTYCTITDTRDDASRKRLHVEVGTKVLIPAKKVIRNEIDPENPLVMKTKEAHKGNPTGNGIVWMRAGFINDEGQSVFYDPEDITVYCYFLPDLT